VFVVLVTVVLLLSLARSAWLGMILGLGFLFLLNRRVQTRLILSIFIFICVLPLLLSIGNLDKISFVARFQAAFDPTDGSTRTRLNRLPFQLNAIRKNPWGIGLGQASRAGRNIQDDPEEYLYYSESVYLQLAMETGYLGIGLFVMLVIISLVFLWKGYFALGAPSEKMIALWALVSAIVVFFASLVFPSLNLLVPPAHAFILVGLTANRFPNRRSI